MPGCVTSWSASRPQTASKATKRCCRGTARQPAHPEESSIPEDGVYGALTFDQLFSLVEHGHLR